MNKIKVISVYIGKFPSYFETVRKSMKYNHDVDWCIYTDTVTVETVDDNLKLIPYSLKEYNDTLSKILNMNVNILKPYKIADTKPLYALAFPHELDGYDWWGFCDLDVIFGNIRRFLTDDVLNENEIITYVTNSTLHGPFSLFKNRKDIIESALCIDYANTINGEFVNVDEIDFFRIIKEKGFKICEGVFNENNKLVPFIRYGKRRTPARWVNGELLLDTYLEDYNHKTFGPYKNETMLIHVRKNYIVRDDVIFNIQTDGDIFEKPEMQIVNNCSYETNKVVAVENVCVINTSNAIGNYYHVLTQYLPSILDFIRKKNTNNINVYVSNLYHPDSLNIFKDVIYNFLGSYPNIINETCKDIKNLNFINPTIIRSVKSLDGMTKLDFETIRSFIPNNMNIKKVKRILVKRDNRYISKEAVDYLTKHHGFEELQMEKFSVLEQTFLFNNADIIVGTHGAGLTNILFCKNGATVIEVNAGYNCGCYPHVRDSMLFKTENINIELYSIFGDSTNDVLKRVELPPSYKVSRYRVLERFVSEPMRFNYVYKTLPNEYSYIPRDGFKEISKNEDVVMDINRFKNTIDSIINSIQQHT